MTTLQRFTMLTFAAGVTFAGCQETISPVADPSTPTHSNTATVEDASEPEMQSAVTLPTVAEPNDADTKLSEEKTDPPVVETSDVLETKAVEDESTNVAAVGASDEPESEMEDSAGEGSNTAGGIGTAKVKDKTLTEELVPEEARKLTEAAMAKLPPILHSLRDSGRLNWKMGELEDDVLELSWKQEQFVLESTKEILAYLNSVSEVRELVWDRMAPVLNDWLHRDVSAKLSAGEFVHPMFREAVSADAFSKTPSPLSDFLEMDKLADLQRQFQHPLWTMRDRVVAKDLRRSDLFYMLAAFRIATDDYAQIINEEAAFDWVIGIPDYRDLCHPENEGRVAYNRANGSRVEVDTRGHVNLPRKHQEDFAAGHGSSFEKPEDPKMKRLREATALLRGERPEPEEPKSLSDKIFRKRVEQPPIKYFLTTEVSPKQRDDLRAKRAKLEKRIATVIELLGPEWAKFDFPSREMMTEDTYYKQRVLMEEIDDRSKVVTLRTFRDFMQRLTTAGSFEKAEEIADEYLSPEHAAELANYVKDASPKTYNEPYTGPDAAFRKEDLTEEVLRAYNAVAGAELNDFFSKPLPKDLTTACDLISQGEHLAAEGQNEQALEKFKVAMQTTSLSVARRKHFADYCSRNGFPDDAGLFWNEPLTSDSK